SAANPVTNAVKCALCNPHLRIQWWQAAMETYNESAWHDQYDCHNSVGTCVVGKSRWQRTKDKDQEKPTRRRLVASLHRRTERHRPEWRQRRVSCVRTERSVFVCAPELQRAEIRLQ